MDNETEVIRGQMDDTREALAKKLETLEDQVKGTVENVTGTVEAVSHTVEQVKDAVTGTVESVRETVGDTVETVKEKVMEAFDLSGHVRRHPWLGFGCSVAAGFLTGRLVPPMVPAMSSGGPRARPWESPSLSTLAERGRHDGRGQEQRREEAPAAPPRQEAPRPSWLENLTSSLGPEVGKLKGLAIGAMLGMARDAITRSLPPEMKAQISDVINDVTQKLGGDVMHSPVLGQTQHQEPAARSGPGW